MGIKKNKNKKDQFLSVLVFLLEAVVLILQDLYLMATARQGYGLWTMDYGLWTMDYGLAALPPLVNLQRFQDIGQVVEAFEAWFYFVPSLQGDAGRLYLLQYLDDMLFIQTEA
jgi:hypothetical protein